MSKQERVVCATVKVSIVKDGHEGSRVVKGIDYKSIHQDGLLSEITHPTYCNVFISGFITNKNRFIDPVEAMKIAIDSQQFEYITYKDMEIRLLERMKLTTQAGISKKLRDDWVDIVSGRGLLPEDLY